MQTDRWSVGEPFLENRKSLSAASLHGKIYIAGISFSTFTQYTAECFDPVSCSWTSLEPFRYLTNVNLACRLLIFNGKLCAFGCKIIFYEYFCFETSLWESKYILNFDLTEYENDHVYYGVMQLTPYHIRGHF